MIEGHGGEGTLNRLRSFSDGAFSIILTLLVLNLALPNLPTSGPASLVSGIRTGADAELVALLKPLFPKFLGYMVSFLVVGIFWTVHVGIVRALRTVHRPGLFANLCYLFPVSLLPFTTDVSTRFRTPLGWSLYAGNIGLAALASILFWSVLARGGCVAPETRRGSFRLIPLRSGLLAAVFFLSIPATYADPVWGRLLPLLLPIGFRVLNRLGLFKKATEAHPVEPLLARAVEHDPALPQVEHAPEEGKDLFGVVGHEEERPPTG